ncbi:ABC transporter ATP-binding protein [Lutispora saccharofermentans]|uniref:ABC transporter ATP-binding protein/permease n=1 Tax=Lutispora saccharofermentans TaxID=3024236 RepID=A0ABT1NKQ3_9FIRM|nr:ABC transporter ATP-binding protein [Lutispora saccharofermentans]MCQ1531839.1 ABC transporter ATP-binding protein/permease [Lutispora saccharofermentans]
MTANQEQDYTKKLDFGLWRKLFQYIIPYKKYVMRLTLVMMAVGGIDVIFPIMTRYAIDNFVLKGDLQGLWIFAGVYALLVLFQSTNIRLLALNAGKIETGVVYDIRHKGFDNLQSLSFSYYDKTPVGWMMARMTSDVQRLGDTIAWGLVDLVWGFTMMTGIAIVMLFMNLKLALISLSVVPFLAIASVYFQQKILKAHRKVRKINSRITGAFNEGIMGAKTTKTLVREKENLKEFKELTLDMYNSSVKAAMYSAVYLPLVVALGSIGTGLAMWYGGKAVMLESISYGTLVLFISYTIQFFEPVRDLARIFSEFQSAQASAERIMSLIETEPEITDTPEVLERYGDVFDPKPENWPPIKGNIAFKNVSFSYKNGEKVLESFNLNIRAGQSIALVGETGSGKSTIVNLLCRFYEPVKGEILIDGVDYKERSQAWLQSNLGYVLQAPHLFSGTVKDNIRYGKLDASSDDIIKAAKLVNAHDFIMKLENGYDTEVGEGGSRLSTGEKQLISFARAILADPRIFVLDEATSSVDTETEKIIQDAIQKVLKGRTSFIIAHRLSTIRSADRILVISDGRIIEDGNHNKLMEERGHYYRLYTNQFMEEQENEILGK